MVPHCSFQIFREDKSIYILVGSCIIFFIMSMDVILYHALQNASLAVPDPVKSVSYSPFHPLTMKLLMIDDTSHYVIKPTTEIFENLTNFSQVFYFITPNMISYFHLVLGLIAGKFVASECIRHRRVGLLLYETKVWLDGLDGVVYRRRVGEATYHSHRDSLGYYIDTICDTAGGFALCFGVLFFVFKYFDKKATEVVPIWNKQKSPNGNANGHSFFPSKKLIFWKTFCYGMMIGASSKCWDIMVEQMELLYETGLQDPHMTKLQTEMLHSWSTWCIILIWRFVQGQQLLHYLVIAILVDKAWEFICLLQYATMFIIGCACAVSYCYVQYVKYVLSL